MSPRSAKRKLSELEQMRARLKQGGGVAEIQKHRRKGKLTARERVGKLLDPGSFEELETWGTPLTTGTLSDYRKGPADAVAVGSTAQWKAARSASGRRSPLTRGIPGSSSSRP